MHTIQGNEPFVLENNQILHNWTIGFSTYGKLNEKRDNVIWVSHALTANSEVTVWWPQIFGENCLFDPRDYFIVCANMLGSCYGSSGPSTPEKNQQALFKSFPEITTRDMANWLDLLRRKLKIDKVKMLIGASIGGQIALEWSILQPDIIENLIVIATNAKHSSYGIAFNESQRWAIENDPSFVNEDEKAGQNGLALARSIAQLSYRTYTGYNLTQEEKSNEVKNQFKASSYQRYQGTKLSERFDAHSYHLLSRAMDSHNVGRNRKSIFHALRLVKASTLVIGINTDQLFPICEQKFLAQNIQHAKYAEMSSLFGHDGFLTDAHELAWILHDFLEEIKETKFAIN